MNKMRSIYWLIIISPTTTHIRFQKGDWARKTRHQVNFLWMSEKYNLIFAFWSIPARWPLLVVRYIGKLSCQCWPSWNLYFILYPILKVLWVPLWIWRQRAILCTLRSHICDPRIFSACVFLDRLAGCIHTSYLSPAPPAVQVSKFPGWCQKIPQITVIFTTITTLVVIEWWWWHHHHHSTTTVTIKFSCVAIYAVLSQN